MGETYRHCWAYAGEFGKCDKTPGAQMSCSEDSPGEYVFWCAKHWHPDDVWAPPKEDEVEGRVE